MGNCCAREAGEAQSLTRSAPQHRSSSASRRDAPQQHQGPDLASERGNLPLSTEPLVWSSSTPVTKDHILKKRAEFWDTAPAYEGRREIWDALKAACETEDKALAQAIIDSAGVKLPKGNLSVAYDELGTRYVVPPYCISFPSNLTQAAPPAVDSASSPASQQASPRASADVGEGEEMTFKVRLSHGQDFTLTMNSADTVGAVKLRIQQQDAKVTVQRQRVMFCGKQFTDNVRLKDIGLGKQDVLQVMVF